MFENRIKELRKEKGLTQQELADRIGASKSAISMYEKGNRRPSFDIADALSDFFGVSIGYLSGSSDQRGEYPRHELPTSSEEEQILAAYRRASKDIRNAVRAVLGIH